MHVFNEDSYKQKIGLMYVSREVLLHKWKFAKRREGSVCSFLPVSCFISNLWGLVNIPVFKAIMNNGKSGRLWHDSEEEEGSTQPTRHRFATIVVGTGSGKRQRYQLKDLKTKEEERVLAQS